MDPWHRVVTPRKEVREGRSFNPEVPTIHLVEVVRDLLLQAGGSSQC